MELILKDCLLIANDNVESDNIFTLYPIHVSSVVERNLYRDKDDLLYLCTGFSSDQADAMSARIECEFNWLICKTYI